MLNLTGGTKEEAVNRESRKRYKKEKTTNNKVKLK